jgi:hypothetical protein
VLAVSYDPVEALGAFAEQFGITYPLLSDPDHRVIESVGILNTLIRPEEGVYGIPFPGSYVVGPDGRVEEKLFFRHYRTRPSAATVLRAGFGVDFEVRDNPRAEAEAEGVRVRATLGGEALVFMESANLYVEFDLDPGLHLSAESGPDGSPMTRVEVSGPERVSVGPAQYGVTSGLRVEGLGVEVPVYARGMAAVVPVMSALAEGESFPLELTVRFQACNDDVCFLPQERRLVLQVPIAPLNRPGPPG